VSLHATQTDSGHVRENAEHRIAVQQSCIVAMRQARTEGATEPDRYTTGQVHGYGRCDRDRCDRDRCDRAHRGIYPAPMPGSDMLVAAFLRVAMVPGVNRLAEFQQVYDQGYAEVAEDRPGSLGEIAQPRLQ